ncbi:MULTISPECIES: hypothetical protein [Enterobacter cloacae complex]|uniref:hypothetical protein n=1 Tax=Enterobacter cloacae complex TaxID=354276 RepID=UPI000798CA43|nr:hypothetical protein [Enterobacter hormaechei]MBA7868168.1 hypothetical protein [Enterobacter hormaechei]MBT1925624.1 hypothetical protein [Enterobacter hormaechei subsp. hoffmannii]MBT1930378.1 hypothetical protein [Enterobacter hormaechei subsp. hoffmannii]MBT1953842.1 hypothetical protein [Enterobacter hormaechei subsp. hoffmannii]MBT1958728.1 hypothetical protein [Enterobacter hormaechei subsp. hoffmannii]
MKFLTVIVAITLLTACQLVRPFGDATTYKPFTVSAHPGLEGRYHCMRSTLDAEGYEVEYISPERDTPNFFDISREHRLIAQVDMYHTTGANFLDITLISGSKQANEDLARVIAHCVSR